MKKNIKTALGITGGLALAAAVVPYFLPVPPLENAVPPEQLAGPDSRFMRVNGVNVHYQLFGTGDPVYLLLHGFSASIYSWRDVVGPLALRGTVLAVDRPGFGLTERVLPDGEGPANPYSIPGQCELLLALLDQLGLRQVIALGHSAGGPVALQLAYDHPERVQALILEDPAVFELDRRSAWVRAILHSRWAYRPGLLLTRAMINRAEHFADRAWYDRARAPADVLVGYLEPLHTVNWDVGIWESVRATQGLAQVARLGSLHLPVLVITGSHDRIVLPMHSERLARMIPGAELVTIPLCGHLPHEEWPDEFVAACDAFTSRLAAVEAEL